MWNGLPRSQQTEVEGSGKWLSMRMDCVERGAWSHRGGLGASPMPQTCCLGALCVTAVVFAPAPSLPFSLGGYSGSF